VIITASAGAATTLRAQTNDPWARPAPRYQFEVRKDVMVLMRDGVRLATDLYLPRGAGEQLPVVLIRLPYNKNTYRAAIESAEFFATQGFAVAVQDVRGKNGSEGTYAADGRRAGWVRCRRLGRETAWSNGKVGTYGCSYLGEVQYLLAKMRHPNHAAMIPQAGTGAVGPAGGYYANFGIQRGGATLLSTTFGWFRSHGTKVKGARASAIRVPALLRSLPVAEMAQKAGFPPTDFEDFVTRPPADAYWAQMHYLRDDDHFDTPSLHVNSWLDVTPEQTLYAFNLMRQRSLSPRARDNQFVIMSPTNHCSSEMATGQTRVGERDFGDARYAYWRLYLDWFDHWLRSVDNGVTKRARVQYYLMGKNEWHTAHMARARDAHRTLLPFWVEWWTASGPAACHRWAQLVCL
jgi:putative CocE/NonD family hydrolase